MRILSAEIVLSVPIKKILWTFLTLDGGGRLCFWVKALHSMFIKMSKRWFERLHIFILLFALICEVKYLFLDVI